MSTDLRAVRGVIRTLNNIIFGYNKPTGRPRGKTKRRKSKSKKNSSR
jgi:hypothetical protein